MHTAPGCIEEIYLEDRRAARISCPPNLVPAPGQYLLATADCDPDASLAQPIFAAGVCSAGFYAAPPMPARWLPGSGLSLRGPLGHGFNLPLSAHQVLLAGFENNCARLLSLLEPALAQKAAVVLLSNQAPAGLPSALEILPLSALPQIAAWADYLAIEIQRERLPHLINLLGLNPASLHAHGTPIAPRAGSAQVLVSTSLPCGGLAECGVCSVSLRPGTSGAELKLACKDGPVFDLY